jgi:uncharacterized membrane protein YagU involved in acid resistance
LTAAIDRQIAAAEAAAMREGLKVAVAAAVDIKMRTNPFFFFNACILRYYLSKPLTSLSCPLNAVFPGLKMWDTFACATAILLTHFIISIAVLENVPPYAGLQKRATFSTLNVGLAGTLCQG